MTNLLLFVALATIIVLIIILAKTFKEKNVLKEELKESQETADNINRQLKDAFESLQKKCDYEKELNDEIIKVKKENESLQSESDGLNARHTEYLLTMQAMTDENNRLKQHIEQLTASIQVNKIETKSKKNRRV